MFFKDPLFSNELQVHNVQTDKALKDLYNSKYN